MNGNSSYTPPKKKYFDKQIPEEDSEFTIPDELHSKHEALDKIFDSYFDYESISNAKQSSKEERDNKNLDDSSYVYGEVVCTIYYIN